MLLILAFFLVLVSAESESGNHAMRVHRNVVPPSEKRQAALEWEGKFMYDKHRRFRVRNQYCSDKKKAVHGEENDLSEIGKPSVFRIDTPIWKDADMKAARIMYSEIQDFANQCGNAYSEHWCSSVVKFIKSGVDYRELELAVLSTHNKLQRKARGQVVSGKDAEKMVEAGEKYEGTMESHLKIVRQYLDMRREEDNKADMDRRRKGSCG